MATADVLNPQQELWYCHTCQKQVLPNLVEFCCSQCEGGFIEPSPNVASHGTNTAEQPMEVAGSSDIATGGRPLDGADSFYASSEGGGGVAVDMGGWNPTGGARSQRVIRRPTRRTHIQVHRVPNTGGAGTHIQSFLNQFMTGLSGGGGAFTGGALNIQVQPLLLTGNTGDYVWTPGGLDNIITMLMNQLDGSGPPPADKSLIDSLPVVGIDQQQVDAHTQCHVCMEDYTLAEQVSRLPCKHVFHADCIVPWLQLHGTCPICRKPLDQQTAASSSSTLPSSSSLSEGGVAHDLTRDDNSAEPAEEDYDSL